MRIIQMPKDMQRITYRNLDYEERYIEQEASLYNEKHPNAERYVERYGVGVGVGVDALGVGVGVGVDISNYVVFVTSK